MFPAGDLVWVDGLCVLQDASGQERMAVHYSRRESLEKQLEHGLAAFDTEENRFKILVSFDLENQWQHLRGHPLTTHHGDQTYLQFGDVYAHIRVPKMWEAIQDPNAYESFGPFQGARRKLCLEEASASGDIGARVKLGGKPGHARVRLLDSQPPCDHRRLGPAASGFCSMESLFEEIHSDCQSNRWLLHVGRGFLRRIGKARGALAKSHQNCLASKNVLLQPGAASILGRARRESYLFRRNLRDDFFGS